MQKMVRQARTKKVFDYSQLDFIMISPLKTYEI